MTSPLMFDSDDNAENDLSAPETSENEEEEETDHMGPRGAASLKEKKILKGLQTVLTGIPPPPAFTVPQFDSREILKLWRENQKYKVEPTPLDKEKSEKVRCVEEEAKTATWPNILGLNHYDVCYNRSSVSEEIEKLCMKYQERYIGAETSSCINALYAKSPVRTASARKRQRNRAWGHSPGRRLSHLARRRKVLFSSLSCSVAGNNNPDKKMIMVEIKKTANRQKKRNSVKKAKPTPNKKTQAEANTYKRALFQSPDQLPSANATRTPSTQCVQRSKRNLFAESSSEKVNDNGKRERPPERRVSPRKRVNRSLSFQESAATHSQPLPSSTCTQPTKSTNQVQSALSDLHRQKLLFACDDALKKQGVKKSKQPDLYQNCMTLLVKSCTKLWISKVAKGEFRQGTTSDNMSLLVKPYTPRAVEEMRKLSHFSSAKRRARMQEIYIDFVKSADSSCNQETLRNASTLASNSCENSTANDSIVGVENGQNSKMAPQNTPVKLFVNKIKDSPRRSSPRLKNLFDNSLIKSVAGPSCSFKTTPVKESSPKLNKTPKTSKVTPKRIYGDLRVMLSAMKEKADSLQKKKNFEINTDHAHASEPPAIDSIDHTQIPNGISSENSISVQNSSSKVERLQDSNPFTSGSIKHSKTKHKANPCDSKSTQVTHRITRRRSQEINSESNSSKENVDDSESEILQSPTKSKITPKPAKNKPKDLQNNSPLKSSNFLKIGLMNSPNKLKNCSRSKNRANSTAASTIFSPEKDEFEIIHKSITPVQKSPNKKSRSLLSKNKTNDLASNVSLDFKNGEILANSSVLQHKSPYKISRQLLETRSPIKSVPLNTMERANSQLTEEAKTESLHLLLRRRSLRSSSSDSTKDVTFTLSNDVNCDNLNKKNCKLDSRHLLKDLDNKENVGNQLLMDNFLHRHLDQSNLPPGDDTPKTKIIPSDPTNRTLELYKLSNSGGEQVETESLHPISVYEEPPTLVPHWELVSTSSESSQSPPPLRPHWEQLSQGSEASSGTATSLPESIMTHWQQIAKTANPAGKIMFDFEDTSYEINFPPTDEDSRASSICPLIDLPFVIDDSKSGFQHGF